jgi:hypothetical protein
VNIMGLMPCSVYTCTFHAKVATWSCNIIYCSLVYAWSHR